MYLAQPNTSQKKNTTVNRICNQLLKLTNLYGQYKFQGDNSRLTIEQSDVKMFVTGSNNFIEFRDAIVYLKLVGDNNMVNATHTEMNVTLNGNNNIVEVLRDDYNSEVIDFIVQSGSSNAVKRVNVFSTSTNKIPLNINNMNNFIKNRNNGNQSNVSNVNLNIFKQNISNLDNGFHNESLFNSNRQNHDEFKMELQNPITYQNISKRNSEKQSQQLQQNSATIKKSAKTYKRGNWDPQQKQFINQINLHDKKYSNQKQNDSYHSNQSNQRQNKEKVSNDLKFKSSDRDMNNNFSEREKEFFLNQDRGLNNIDKIKRGNWNPNTQTDIVQMIDEEEEATKKQLFHNDLKSNQQKDISKQNIFNLDDERRKKNIIKQKNNNLTSFNTQSILNNGSQTQRIMPSSQYNIFDRNYQKNLNCQENKFGNQNCIKKMYDLACEHIRNRTQNQKVLQIQKLRNPEIFKPHPKSKQVEKQKDSFDSAKACSGYQDKQKNNQNRAKKEFIPEFFQNNDITYSNRQPQQQFNLPSNIFNPNRSNNNSNFHKNNIFSSFHQNPNQISNIANHFMFQSNNNNNLNAINQRKKQQSEKPPNIPPINSIFSNNRTSNQSESESNKNRSNSFTGNQHQQRPITNFRNIFQRNLQRQRLNNRQSNEVRNIFSTNNPTSFNNIIDLTNQRTFVQTQQRNNDNNDNESSLTAIFGPRANQLRYDEDVISVSDSDSQSMPVEVPQRRRYEYGSTYIFNNTTNIFNTGSRYHFPNEENGRNIFARQNQIFMSSNNVFNGGGGLTPDEISKLPKSLNSHNSELICLICISEITKHQEEVTFLFCFHYYHSKCIQTWLKQKATCPSCQHNVREGIKNDKLKSEQTPKEDKKSCQQSIFNTSR